MFYCLCLIFCCTLIPIFRALHLHIFVWWLNLFVYPMHQITHMQIISSEMQTFLISNVTELQHLLRSTREEKKNSNRIHNKIISMEWGLCLNCNRSEICCSWRDKDNSISWHRFLSYANYFANVLKWFSDVTLHRTMRFCLRSHFSPIDNNNSNVILRWNYNLEIRGIKMKNSKRKLTRNLWNCIFGTNEATH